MPFSSSYADALNRINTLRAKDGSDINPVCGTEFLTHGDTTDRVILFLHGYTNCPQQFHQLSTMFYERGYNVLNARIPYHGHKNRLTKMISRLTADDLIDISNELVDIGHGLGRHITLCGLSASGTAAAWAGQNRPDLDLAVMIAPGFVVKGIPRSMAPTAANVMPKLPNIFIWWNPKEKAKSKPDYAYPRFSVRSLGELMKLGKRVRRIAKISKPLARKLLVVTNNADPAVNNKATYSIMALWQEHGGTVEHFEFDKELKLKHDLIDPNQPDQHVDLVYPKLIELIDKLATI